MVIDEQSAREVQACVDALETTSPVSATEIGRVLLWFVLINFFPIEQFSTADIIKK